MAGVSGRRDFWQQLASQIRRQGTGSNQAGSAKT